MRARFAAASGAAGVLRYERPMSTEPPMSDEEAAKLRRQKLFGRLMIIGLGLLVLAYIIPTFMNGR